MTGVVLIVGDVMLDVAVHGRVERISPEAPVPVLVRQSETTTLGGAGNVYRGVRAWGGEAYLLGVSGVGGYGFPLHNMVERGQILGDMGRRTTVKWRYLSGSHHLLRVDQESTEPLSDEMAARVLEAARGVLARGEVRCLVLSDYAKGVITRGLARVLIDEAKAAGAFVLVDPKQDFQTYVGADLVTPNWREFVAALGSEPKNPEAVVTAAWSLIERYGLGALLVTMGERGMVLVKQGEVREVPAVPVPAVDATGAGDTVVAVLAASVAAGLPLAEAVVLANAAAAVAVTRAGAAEVVRADVKEAGVVPASDSAPGGA